MRLGVIDQHQDEVLAGRSHLEEIVTRRNAQRIDRSAAHNRERKLGGERLDGQRRAARLSEAHEFHAWIGRKATEGIDGIYRIGLVIQNLDSHLVSVEAALRIDPLHPGMHAIDHVLAKARSRTAHRCDHAHLDPEGGGLDVGVEVGGHQQQAAHDHDRQAADDDAMHAVQPLGFRAGLVRTAPRRRHHPGIGGDRAAAAAQQPAQVRERHGTANRRRIRVNRRPGVDELARRHVSALRRA